MRPKKRELVKLLLREQEKFVTSKMLATELSLSDRTIRQYIQDLKETLAANGAEIISKQGHGFQFLIHNHQQFDLFMSENKLVDLSMTPIKFSDATDRKKYVLNKLLLEGEAVQVGELADEMFISSSQLSKDFAELRQLLSTYQLSLEKEKQGFVINGEEREKRHFIMDFFFGHEYTNLLQNFVSIKGLVDDISFESLTIIILDECREAHLKLSDFIIQNLVLHLSLSIKRMRSGLGIQDMGTDASIHQRKEYQVATQIVKRLEPIVGVTFPAAELDYLTLHLMAKSTQISLEENSQLERDIQASLGGLQEVLGYPLQEDRQLIEGLLEHMRPMLIRLEKQIRQENPLLREIQTRYKSVFEATRQVLSQMDCFKAFQVSDDEWAYITLHILAAIEKLNDQRKARVLIICATGYGSAQLLKARVEKEFGKHISVTDVKGYYEINEASLHEIDMIISSIDLTKIIFKIPVIHVSVFLNETDIQRIRYSLEKFVTKEGSNTHQISPHHAEMASFFSEKAFHVYSTAVTKVAVMDALLAQLADNEEGHYQIEMKQQIIQRQQLGQIAFSDTIVVPHPAIPVGKISKIGVAIIPTGLFWNEEFPAIQFIFLVSPSIYENEGLPVATRKIVALIENQTIQKELLEVTQFQQFLELFDQL